MIEVNPNGHPSGHLAICPLAYALAYTHPRPARVHVGLRYRPSGSLSASGGRPARPCVVETRGYRGVLARASYPITRANFSTKHFRATLNYFLMLSPPQCSVCRGQALSTERQ
ncbi:hypothetical protein BQ8794_170018 [Mesorhizobium prunaredense]|uniref:Uncharacterized protein n=1 Tax=Mesorhizobium prunaredense TaxID=1631249 RepID=A0A1R3V834_9HYPH|nr:hypothetical protein BQ8794_170018 [Mesorhizobium prunaredense]